MVDDHALLAESVVITLQRSGLDARTVASTTPNLVEKILDLQPDLVLLDLFLTDTTDISYDVIVRLSHAGVRVVVVTATHDALLHARCLELGAAGVIEKSQPIEQLVEAVHRGLRGDHVMHTSKVLELRATLDKARREHDAPSPFDYLTVREKQILAAIMDGHAAGRIARDHSVSILTVRSHIRSMLAKLGVHSQLEAVSLATREQWFDRSA